MRKRTICALTITLALVLTACGGEDGGQSGDELALEIRTTYLAMSTCAATMEVTADYGQRVYDYTLGLDYAREGETVLTVLSPEEIAGVTARVADGSAIMLYDGVSVETGPLDTEGLSPIGAVPAILEAVKSAYIAETGTETLDETDCLRVCYRDPEAKPGTGTELTAWFKADDGALVRGEVAADGRTVVQCVFTAFAMT